jgi:predicted Rossmann fold nucleotide-binding protein DprA/Smf involved in DNA uptake
MRTDAQAQAVLLLTTHLPKAAARGVGAPRPLSAAEWGRFALGLKERGLAPEALLAGDPAALLAGWGDQAVTGDRIRALLARGAVLALALERWQRAGLWVLIRSDPEHPERLKRLLKTESPPVLFGCGDRGLLQRGGIAVVGSRDAGEDDLAFTTHLAGRIAAQGASLVSGGARGVDEAALLGALAAGGTAVGVLADSLLRTATSAKYRKGLMGNGLVLVSPFQPEAGFDAGNAMARNRYVYCLADAAVVIASGREQGGTWNGAVENLRHGWTPLWIKPSQDTGSGNAELVRRGARWLPPGDPELAALAQPGPPSLQEERSLFDDQPGGRFEHRAR